MKTFLSKIMVGLTVLSAMFTLASPALAESLTGQPNVSLDQNGAGQTSTATVSFRTTTGVGLSDNQGQIQVTFPAGFDLTGANVTNPSANLGILSEYGDADRIYLFSFTNPGGLPASSDVSFDLTGIVNPNISGIYHLDIATWENNGSELVDGPTSSFNFSIMPRAPNQANSSISPSGLNELTVGTSTAITFTARDEFNNLSSGQDVAWSSSNSNFTLSKTSGITDANGQDNVTITAPQQAGLTTTVTVQSGTVVHNVTFTSDFVSTPDSLHHWGLSNVDSPQTAGSFFDIFVTPYDQYNNAITDYDWNIVANRPSFSGLNSIGSWDPSYTFITFSSGVATYRVTPYAAQTNATITSSLGSANGISNSFNVNHNVANSIALNPSASTINADQTQTYTVGAADAFNNQWDVTSQTNLSIEPAAGGSWTANIFSPQYAGGPYDVTGTYNGNTGHASLTVTPGATTRIDIDPDTDQTVAAGQDLHFTATPYDQFDNVTSDTIDWTEAPGGLFNETVTGIYNVHASVGVVESAHVNVTVEPADLHHINVTPADDQTITAGETINFEARSYDIYNNERFVDTFTWVDTSAVDSGFFNNTTVGDYQVYAMSNGVESNRVNVRVNHNVVVRIEVTPDNSTITADDFQTFYTWGYDQYENTWEVTNQTSYEVVDGGDFGSFVENIYYPHAVGTWTVRGTHDGLTDDASLIVTHGVATSLDVSPTNASLTADQSQQFTAVATDADGNSWNATNEAAWTHTDPWGSVVNGLYSAGQVGSWVVTATLNGQSDFADVTVTHGNAVSLGITPTGPLFMTSDDLQAFNATGTDADGNSWDATNEVTWNENDTVGGFAGSTYNPGAVGTWTIYANIGLVNSNNVTVNVSHGVASFFDIFPDSVDLNADQTQQFGARATDADGNYWDVTGETTWSTTDPAGAISAGGLYNAARVGDWQVRGDYNSFFDISNVHISHGNAVSLGITPIGPLDLTADQSQAFEATATDSDGNSWSVTGEVNWNENDALGGFVGNTYNAGAVGTVTIFASFDLLNSNNVTVNVSHGAEIGINLTPDSDTVTAGQSETYTVTARDADGNTWDVTPSSTYQIVGGGDGGTWAVNVYTTHTAGTWTVRATYNGFTDDATLTVNHAEVDRVVISPASVDIARSGQTQSFTLTAYDLYDNSWVVTEVATYTIDVNDAYGRMNDNTYTAGTLGTHHVIGTYQTKSATATVNVLDHATGISTLTIVNKITSLMVGNSHNYQVRLRDSYGNSWDGTALATYTLSPEGLANIDANGVMNGLVVGSVIVTATYGSHDDTDTVDIVAAGGGTLTSSSNGGTSTSLIPVALNEPVQIPSSESLAVAEGGSGANTAVTNERESIVNSGSYGPLLAFLIGLLAIGLGYWKIRQTANLVSPSVDEKAALNPGN